MRYAWVILLVFAAPFCVTAIAYPQVDGDLSWQRWLGRTIVATGMPHVLGSDVFSAPGAPWTPQEWLFSLLAARATDGIAWNLFAGAIAVGAIAALAIGAWHAVRRGASDRAVVVCLVFAGFALFGSFGVRVQVAAWPLLASFVALLDIEGPWTYAAIAVAAAWSNVHASAVLAPIVAAIAALGTLVDERGPTPHVRRLALVAAGSALAICANPFGSNLPHYALSLFNSSFKAQITEWRPTDVGNAMFAYGALPLLLLAALAGPRGDRRARDVATLVAFGYLLLGASRNIAIFGIVALPIVAPAITRAFAWFARTEPTSDERTERIARVALPAFGLAMAIVVGIGLLRSTARTTDDLATNAIASVSHLAGERRLFCADFAWCGLAVGVPRVRVFLDGRADPFPLAVWTDFDVLAHVRPGWQTVLAKYDVDTVVVERDAPLDVMLAKAATWRISYRDKRYRVWARASTSAAGERARRRGSERGLARA